LAVLMGYGFCIPSNPYDQVALRFRPPLQPAQLDALKQQPSYDTKTHNEGLYFITNPRLRDHLWTTREAFLSFHPLLISTFYVLLADPHNLANLTQNKCPASRLTFLVIDGLFAALTNKLSNITQHDANIPKLTTNRRQRNAQLYRISQIQILDEAVRPFERRVSRALDTGELLTLQTGFSLQYFEKHTLAALTEGLRIGWDVEADTGDLPAVLAKIEDEADCAEELWTFLVAVMRAGALRKELEVSSVASRSGDGNVLEWVRSMRDQYPDPSQPTLEVGQRHQVPDSWYFEANSDGANDVEPQDEDEILVKIKRAVRRTSELDEDDFGIRPPERGWRMWDLWIRWALEVVRDELCYLRTLQLGERTKTALCVALASKEGWPLEKYRESSNALYK
jgi:hypothetical protein